MESMKIMFSLDASNTSSVFFSKQNQPLSSQIARHDGHVTYFLLNIITFIEQVVRAFIWLQMQHEGILPMPILFSEEDCFIHLTTSWFRITSWSKVTAAFPLAGYHPLSIHGCCRFYLHQCTRSQPSSYSQPK
jgi:hypothetical protein